MVDNREAWPLSYSLGLVGGRVLRFLVWIISAALKPKGLLVAENLCLRQQLLVLQRRHPQPRLRNADRQFWIAPVDGSLIGAIRSLL